MKSFFSLVLILTLQSCSTTHNVARTPSESYREIASTSTPLKEFIKHLAKATKKSEDAIEKEVLDQLKKRSDVLYRDIGLNSTDLKKLRSLDDDEPYMLGIQKWVMRNADDLISGVKNPRDLTNAFKKAAGDTYVTSPYPNARGAIGASMRTKPKAKLDFAGRLRSDISVLIRNLRGKADRQAKENILGILNFQGKLKDASIETVGYANKILDASAEMLHLTKGQRTFMQKGCFPMLDNASPQALSNIGDIGQDFAQRVRMKKASLGGAELTQSQLDEALNESFVKVLRVTEDEASTRIKFLKREPCGVF